MDLMNCDKILIEIKDAVYLWISTNPVTFGLLTAGLTWLVKVTPWKWDDSLLERLKWWKNKNT
jgi:hypothetical protein